MTSIFAHGFGGTNGLPLPRWLLAYSIGFAVVLAFVALRAVLAEPRPLEQRRFEPVAPSPLFIALRAVGMVLFAGLLVAAAFGLDDPAANISPTALIVIFWLGFQVLSVVVGDMFWLLDPFDTLAKLAPQREPEPNDGPDPHWTAAAFLLSFVWFVFAYPEFYPPTPHEIAWFLGVYTMAVLAGACVWGRGWVREGEGFSALFGLLARRREHPPSSGTVALLSVYLGAILFDAISQTDWWVDVLGTSRGWHERSLNTLGLVWTIALVGLVYVGAARIGARLAGRSVRDVTAAFAPALVPLGVGWSVAHYTFAFLVDGQNFIALLSDPLGKDWDLFGTINNSVDYALLSPNQLGWVQTIVLLVGCLASAYLVHRVTLTQFRTRRGVQVLYPFAIALVVAVVGAVQLLLGT